MAMQRNRNRQVIFHDIAPLKKPLKPAIKVAKKMQKIKIVFMLLFNLPVIQRFRKKLSVIPKKTKVIGIIVCIGVIILLGSFLMTSRPVKVVVDTKSTTNKTSLVRGTPDFSILSPDGKSVQDLNGSIRSDNKQLFVYVDKIGNVQINVSQQPLPNEFKTDTDQQIEQLAKSYKANGKITVGSILVHIGASIKGPQSVIFTKNNLLILIVSSDSIKNDRWARYINSLQQPD